MLEYTTLFLAAFIAATISGVAGFGGALLLLPLLVQTVGVIHAVPLLTFAQLIGNLSRVAFGFSQVQWMPVALFLLGAIPFSILGAISFIELPKELVTRGIGLVILLFVSLKYTNILNFKVTPALLIAGGGFVGYLSGLVGSAGPLGAAIFLSMGLPPVAYVASEGTTALVMHGVKLITYQQYISLDQSMWITAALMGMAMIAGSWVAKRVIERIPQKRFECYVVILLISIAAYMIIHV